MKKWLIAATLLIIVGCLIFAGGMQGHQWDFSGLETDKYETNAHTISDSYHSISIATDTAGITFLPSADDKTSVVCYELKNAKHAVSVQDDTLTIALEDTRQWYDHIGIYFKNPKITVYLPQSLYSALCVSGDTGNVNIPEDFQFESIAVSLSTGSVTNRASASESIQIATTTGRIEVNSVVTNTLDLSVTTGSVFVTDTACHGGINIDVSTGKATLNEIRCKSLVSSGDTGDIHLENVVATEKFFIVRDTGDVRFDNADAAEIFVETDTGDVTGSLLTDKVFIAKTDTGRVSLPNTVTGGRCEITTDTGDINIRIK